MTVATHGQTTVRVATVPAVLIAEYLCLFLVLAWRHDIDAVEALPSSWQGLLWAGSGFAGAMIAALGAFAVLWDGSIADRMRAALAGTRPVTGGSLSVHFASYAAFAGLTILILARPDVAADLGWPLLVLWLGVAVSVPTSLVIAVLGASTKAVLRAAGPHVALAAVLGTATGVAAVQILPYWRALSDPTLRLVTAMLEAAGFTVLVEPALPGIQLGDFGAHIGATCSGIEGMAMITVLLAGYLYRFREEHRFPQALLVFPAAIAISFVANAARIAILLWVGDRIDPQLAKGAFHSMAGWVFFCGISLGIIATLRRLPWMTRHLPVAPSLRDDSLEVTAYLLPFLVWLALSLVSAAFGHLGELAYGLRVAAVGAVLVLYRAPLADAIGRLGRVPAPITLAAAAPWLCGTAVFLFWLALAPVAEPAEAAAPATLTALPPVLLALWIALRVIGSVIIVPVIEELAFRGYLQRRLISADWLAVAQDRLTPFAVLGSATAFGMLHGAWLAGILSGILFSLMTRLRGRLIDAIIAHAVANALIAIWVIGFGRWDLW
ncbi:exosortase E/protease, VPEID-CTERM system [Salipiger bermudensis]|uniref:exosortase E/protease, VPEID-CTERM system n=1 Tax=Salipiger bermudensis TaxID=344736 RepID=UPI00241432EF|nr:exosortase E/protease, VPEID-CTERM system [Salipiger bermudensis]